MTDVNQLITEHLDIWTSAIEKKSSAGRGNGGSVSLYGIRKLRALVLELAIRGKLAPQDADDGEANSHLADVIRVRSELVKHGKAKKLKKLPAIPENEIPFEAPKGWVWARLQDISGYIQRGKSPQYANDGRVQVVSQKCVQWGKFDLEKARYISDESIEGYGPERFLRSGDILWNSTGTGTVGRVLTVEIDEDQTLVADSHVTVVRPISGCPKFLEVYLSSAGIQDRIEPAHERSLVSGSTKQVELNTSTVIALPIPLPPLAEQHRIVAKVDELMALCDALERQTEDSLKNHQTLVETCLASLTSSQSPEDLTQNWARIEAHFNTLFTTEESVRSLRECVLKLAVMGLLVDQEKSLHSGELLNDALKLRAELVAQKDAKPFKAHPIGEQTEKPFNLPEGWSWLRLGDGTSLITKGSSPKWQGVSYTEDPEEVMFVTSENVGRFEMLLDEPKFVEAKFNELEPRSMLKQGDFLMNIVGASIGRTAIFDGPEGANINQAVCLIRVLPNLFDERFLIAFFNSEFCRNYMFDKQVDNARANLSMGNISQFLIPLPPLKEQQLISEKLHQISLLSKNLSEEIETQREIEKTLSDTLASQIH